MRHRAEKPTRKPKSARDKPPPSRFAPAAFLSGSPEAVQQLCQDLATLSANRFADLTGTTWTQVATSIVDQLRATGHDLMSYEEGDGTQEWQATWHHPRGTFSLSLSFRAPTSVEVTWKADDAAFVARA